MNKFVLPYEFDVLSISSQFDAFYLGINKAINPCYLDDVFNDYGQVMLIEPSLLNFYSSWIYMPDMYHKLDIQFNKNIDEGFKEFNEPNFLIYLKKLLEQGFYIQGFYDEYFIPGKDAYEKYPLSHGYLIYGYDDKNQCFLSAGYNNDIYKPFNIEYSNFLNSITSKNVNSTSISFIKPNEKYLNIPTDIKKVYVVIRGYLESIDIYGGSSHSKLFGVDAVRYVIDAENERERFDLKNIRLLFEFRHINQLKLEFLLKNNYMSDEKIISEQKALTDESRITLILATKYNITLNKDLRERVLCRLTEQLNKEIKILHYSLDDLAETSDLEYLNEYKFK